jgi:hypothetical protein
LGGPAAEGQCCLQIGAVTNRKNDVERIQRDGPVGFCNVHFLRIAFFVSLAVSKDMLDVASDDGPVNTEQLGDLRQPPLI